MTRMSSRAAAGAVGAAAPGTAAAAGALGTAAGAPGFGGAAAGAGMSASFACSRWGGIGGRVSFCHASHSIRSENEKMMNRMSRCVSMRCFFGRGAPLLAKGMGEGACPPRLASFTAPDRNRRGATDDSARSA